MEIQETVFRIRITELIQATIVDKIIDTITQEETEFTLILLLSHKEVII